MLVALYPSHGASQQPADAAAKPQIFEVASIKPNRSGSNRVNMSLQPGGRFTAINVSLGDLIRMSYGDVGPLQTSRMSGGPRWLNADRFDVIAKADGNPTQDEIKPFVRALLAERFKLVMHHETRQLPFFALVLARADGRLGPHLRRSETDCVQPQGGPPPTSAAGTGTLPPCQLKNFPGTLSGRGLPIAALARSLVSHVDDHREVRDETGLSGLFDFDLQWTPERVPEPPPDGPALPPIDPNGASLFTAIQEQLGLKLAPRKDQIDVLVIDQAEPPTPN